MQFNIGNMACIQVCILDTQQSISYIMPHKLVLYDRYATVMLHIMTIHIWTYITCMHAQTDNTTYSV